MSKKQEIVVGMGEEIVSEMISVLVEKARKAQALIASYTQEQIDEVCVAAGWEVYKDDKDAESSDKESSGNLENIFYPFIIQESGYSRNCKKNEGGISERYPQDSREGP